MRWHHITNKLSDTTGWVRWNTWNLTTAKAATTKIHAELKVFAIISYSCPVLFDFNLTMWFLRSVYHSLSVCISLSALVFLAIYVLEHGRFCHFFRSKQIWARRILDCDGTHNAINLLNGNDMTVKKISIPFFVTCEGRKSPPINWKKKM